MADDDVNEEELPEEEVPDLDGELEEGEDFVEPDDDDDAVAVVAVVDDDAEDEDDDEPVPAGKKRAKGAAEDEDDDEIDPDDVEADLDAILKDRIAAADDEEDDDEEEVVAAPARTTADTPDGVVPKRANEFMCTGCFLLVNRAQFGPPGSLECPVGESDCPAIALIEAEEAGR